MACMHACVRACVRTYVRTYIHTYIHTYMHASMHACMHTYLPNYLRTYVRTYVRTYLHLHRHRRRHGLCTCGDVPALLLTASTRAFPPFWIAAAPRHHNKSGTLTKTNLEVLAQLSLYACFTAPSLFHAASSECLRYDVELTREGSRKKSAWNRMPCRQKAPLI